LKQVTGSCGLANLRESGAIEQDADVVALIHRPAYYGIKVDKKGVSTIGRLELIIAKNRNDATSTVFFRHNPSLTRIEPDVEQQKLPF
jgi:replicative DNA helicase